MGKYGKPFGNAAPHFALIYIICAFRKTADGINMGNATECRKTRALILALPLLKSEIKNISNPRMAPPATAQSEMIAAFPITQNPNVFIFLLTKFSKEKV